MAMSYRETSEIALKCNKEIEKAKKDLVNGIISNEEALSRIEKAKDHALMLQGLKPIPQTGHEKTINTTEAIKAKVITDEAKLEEYRKQRMLKCIYNSDDNYGYSEQEDRWLVRKLFDRGIIDFEEAKNRVSKYKKKEVTTIEETKTAINVERIKIEPVTLEGKKIIAKKKPTTTIRIGVFISIKLKQIKE
jgi:hypothetical protein